MEVHITDSLNFCRQFVGRKIKKVVWQATSNNFDQSKSNAAWNSKTDDYFASGSWDDGSNNEVAIYRVETAPDCRQSEGTETIFGEEKRFVKCASFLTSADVMDLDYITSDKLIYCSSEGDLTLLNYNQANSQLKRINRWTKLHDGCCTALSVFGEEIVTVGEDGRLNFVNLSKMNDAKTSSISNLCEDKKPYSPFYSINRLGKNEIIAGNSLGQIMVVDLRSENGENFLPLVLPCLNRTGAATALEKHPAQPHLLIAGYQSGDAGFWDLRSPNIPVFVSSAHSGPIWRAKFHPYYCNNFFTCGEDGRLIHWDISVVQKPVDRLE
uniref:Nucleoporin Nup43 n=1 Tax=Romanomermis culicivorax TaxID=13658 RepID=A0A915KWZ6_ROMCU